MRATIWRNWQNVKRWLVTERFRDRAEAGRVLAGHLAHWRGQPGVLVLALPRGGVPVGYEVARSLDAPLDVFLVRKLGVPGHPELAMGALASGGVRVINEDVVSPLQIPGRAIDDVTRSEQVELQRREAAYRGQRPAPEVRDRVAILVDDGLATGSTMRAALTALRLLAPRRLIVAVPVGAPQVCQELQALADEVVCALMPPAFRAVGLWYDDFSETTDEEVRAYLERAATAGIEAGQEEHCA
jgi:putative phosphoribosyl transferase